MSGADSTFYQGGTRPTVTVGPSPPPSDPWTTRLGASMDLFTFRGTPVRAHWSVAAGIVLIFVSTATSWDADTGEDILMGLLASFSLYFFVMLHELGHVEAHRCTTGSTCKVTMHLLGGVSIPDDSGAVQRRYAEKRGTKAWVHFAGPLVNIVLCLVFLLPALLTTWLPLLYMAVANGVLAAYNLLPVSPMDGGEILLDLLLCCGLPLVTAAYVTYGVAVLGAIALIVFSSAIGLGDGLSYIICALIAGISGYRAYAVWKTAGLPPERRLKLVETITGSGSLTAEGASRV